MGALGGREQDTHLRLRGDRRTASENLRGYSGNSPAIRCARCPISRPSNLPTAVSTCSEASSQDARQARDVKKAFDAWEEQAGLISFPDA